MKLTVSSGASSDSDRKLSENSRAQLSQQGLLQGRRGVSCASWGMAWSPLTLQWLHLPLSVGLGPGHCHSISMNSEVVCVEPVVPSGIAHCFAFFKDRKTNSKMSKFKQVRCSRVH